MESGLLPVSGVGWGALFTLYARSKNKGREPMPLDCRSRRSNRLFQIKMLIWEIFGKAVVAGEGVAEHAFGA